MHAWMAGFFRSLVCFDAQVEAGHLLRLGSFVDFDEKYRRKLVQVINTKDLDMQAWLSGGLRGWVLEAMKAGRHLDYLGSFFDLTQTQLAHLQKLTETDMRVWLAGHLDNNFRNSMEQGGCSNYLGAFPTPDRAMHEPHRFKFFLDSGAYSAWSQGTEIDLEEYCAFIRANIDLIEVYACLDAIPGAPGRAATIQERQDAAERTWQNYLFMKNEGLDPLPVYHYGEDMRFLERMLDYGCEYIGIGGLVGIPGPSRQLWLDRVFTRLTDDKGQPLVKTHGFGMTAVPLVFRYPWYSIDSTTWIKITAAGGIYLPAMVDGEFVFDQIPTTVAVSNKNPKQTQGGKHANSMGPSMRKILDRWLEVCGKTYAEVEESYYHRATCNVMFFKKLSELKANRPFEHRTQPRKVGLW